ncbi:MAG: hypothetical protein ACLSHC_10920 [Bilophila wadsworthia]
MEVNSCRGAPGGWRPILALTGTAASRHRWPTPTPADVGKGVRARLRAVGSGFRRVCT